jgi:hypothetical protein
MVEIVNLRQARKRKERRRRETTAEENRARFGRSKAEASIEAAQRRLEAARLDGHQREDGDDD